MIQQIMLKKQYTDCRNKLYNRIKEESKKYAASFRL